ncbi:DDHD domain-containing protein [Pilaira anomala]|nr:DDHD domain-containing protein [Pilaira anomala]
MFFEATYVPSPPLSVTSLDDLQDIPTQIEPDVEPAAPKPVDHLIFVIHGIGQQTEQYGHFYEHIENLQETTRQVLQAKVPDHNVRIELIPIEWHRHIHEQVDPIINKITLKSLPTIRLIENDYLADVLFYFSKDRGQNIVDNVTQLFNTSYHNFKEKHPNFDGKIVILGYSLGGVIVWDILSHQREPSNQIQKENYQKLDNIKFSKLDFKPDFFYGLGSPLGAVLTFRGQDPTHYHPETDIQFENVFHPFDPIGYRFEPLYSDYFTDKPAVLIERSIPFGPSFSFPSMPSFPLTAGFFSFFSWKSQDKAAKTMFNATAEAANQAEESNIEPTADINSSSAATGNQQQSGFMSSVMGYFSKGGGTKQEPRKETDPKDIGIITWDPLKEQTREQLLALRDDLDRTLNNTSIQNVPSKRPNMNIRSKTYAAHDDSLYSSSLEQNSDGSVLDKATKNNSSSSNSSTTLETNALRRTLTFENHPTRQHLVEVLGIDGVRVDSFERARVNFDKHENKSENGSGGDDIWSDLNKELNKPGPAITNPGESRADVAQDATVPTAAADETEEQAVEITTEEDEARIEQEEINRLPGKCRLDYVLQPDSVMSMIANEYLIGLRAHFSYWTNKDLIWHMLRRVENLDETKNKTPDEFKNNPNTTTTTNSKPNTTTTTSSLMSDKSLNASSAASVVSIDDSTMLKKNTNK